MKGIEPLRHITKFTVPTLELYPRVADKLLSDMSRRWKGTYKLWTECYLLYSERKIAAVFCTMRYHTVLCECDNVILQHPVANYLLANVTDRQSYMQHCLKLYLQILKLKKSLKVTHFMFRLICPSSNVINLVVCKLLCLICSCIMCGLMYVLMYPLYLLYLCVTMTAL
jgi:hypothetical protein